VCRVHASPVLPRETVVYGDTVPPSPGRRQGLTGRGRRFRVVKPLSGVEP
jgi:hypothetical protein